MRPPENGEKLFTEYQIISLSEGKKRPYLEFLYSKINTIYTAEYNWGGTSDNPILKAEFNTAADFLNAYGRLNRLFDKISSLILSGDVNLEDFKFPEKQIKKAQDPSTDEIFLILKITTNWKEPLRRDFRNAIGIANLLNLTYSYEEVEDGFLIFYPTLQSFQDAQVNRLNAAELEQWLKKRKVWSEKLGNVIKKLFLP